MTTPNHGTKPSTSMDALQQHRKPCGAGGTRLAAGTAGRSGRVLGSMLLAAAAALASAGPTHA
jgi:hypothetical protein